MSNELSEVIEIRVGRVWLDMHGFLRYVVVLPNAEVVLADAEEIVAAYRKINGGRVRPALSDIRNVKSVTREARVYAASDDATSLVNASAVLVDSPISRVVGNFFLGINKPSYPMRLFSSEDDAVAWLNQYIE